MSLLTDLYWGKITPCEEFGSYRKSYFDALKQAAQVEEEIQEKYKISWEDAVRLEDAYIGVQDVIAELNFATGIQLGSGLMLELFGTRNSEEPAGPVRKTEQQNESSIRPAVLPCCKPKGQTRRYGQAKRNK